MEGMKDTDHEHRDIFIGIHKRCWNVIPTLDRTFAANRLNDSIRCEAVLREPPVYIDYENSEARQQDDKLQTSDDNLAAEFITEFALASSPEDLYIVKADVIRPLPE